MTEKEALALLGVEEVDAELISDAYEAACFKEKNLFLKDPVLPSLIDNKLKKITNLSQALFFLIPNKHSSMEVSYSLSDLKGKEWNEFFLHYEKNKAVLRKELANHFDVISLTRVLEDLKKNEIEYMNRLMTLIFLKNENEAKLSVQLPIIEILNELNHYLEQGVIDKSWESLVNLSDRKDNFKISLEISRVNKLLNGKS